MNTESREDIPEIPVKASAPVARGSWWLEARTRDGFTQIGARETAKTAHSPVAAAVAFRIIQE